MRRLLGHDFGRTPMGHAQVVAVAARRDRCTCKRWFIRRGWRDGACPLHGIEVALRAAVRQLREDEARC